MPSVSGRKQLEVNAAVLHDRMGDNVTRPLRRCLCTLCWSVLAKAGMNSSHEGQVLLVVCEMKQPLRRSKDYLKCSLLRSLPMSTEKKSRTPSQGWVSLIS